MQTPRLRQCVLAARELDAVAGRLRSALGLAEPFADEGVGYFGLRNAVFTVGDTFLEVVSPVKDGTAAGRHLDRHGGDCGYMVMFQLDDVAAARARVDKAGVRSVFAVDLEDMVETHLHPGDMRGAIVAVSEPRPSQSWRWGGPGWQKRAAPGAITGATLAVADPDAVRDRWTQVLGAPPPVEFVADPAERGLVEVKLSGDRDPVEIAGVRFVYG